MAYKLYIEQIMTDWYGEQGFGKWTATVSDEGFEEIKKDPRQDFIDFGVASVDYTRIEAYKIEEIEHEDYTETREYQEPIIIEDGKADLNAREAKQFRDMLFEQIHI